MDALKTVDEIRRYLIEGVQPEDERDARQALEVIARAASWYTLGVEAAEVLKGAES